MILLRRIMSFEFSASRLTHWSQCIRSTVGTRGNSNNKLKESGGRIPTLTGSISIASTNQVREYLDWLTGELGITNIDEWYNVAREEVIKRGGGGLIKFYGGFLSNALVSVYPERNWQGWKFPQLPKNFWENRDNQK